MGNELKPCPFCGGDMLFVGTIAEVEMQDEDHPDYYYNNNHYMVVCDCTEGGCGVSCGHSYETAEEAIEAWNRRANENR